MNLLFLQLCTFVFVITSCKVEKGSSQFELPVITNSSFTSDDTLKYYSPQFLYDLALRYVGKFRVAAPVDISPETTYLRSLDARTTSDSLYRKLNLDINGFEIFVDTSTIPFNPYYGEPDSFYAFHLIYIVNSTTTPKVFHGKDHYAYGIVEARRTDRHNLFYAITAQYYDFCANGSWAIQVNPNEYIALAAPKLKGDYRTELRIRLKNGESMYVSKPFAGSINYNQFILPPVSQLREQIKESPLTVISRFHSANFDLTDVVE